jgi:hypothetical protein
VNHPATYKDTNTFIALKIPNTHKKYRILVFKEPKATAFNSPIIKSIIKYKKAAKNITVTALSIIPNFAIILSPEYG